jgi:hypothetical protein
MGSSTLQHPSQFSTRLVIPHARVCSLTVRHNKSRMMQAEHAKLRRRLAEVEKRNEDLERENAELRARAIVGGSAHHEPAPSVSQTVRISGFTHRPKETRILDLLRTGQVYDIKTTYELFRETPYPVVDVTFTQLPAAKYLFSEHTISPKLIEHACPDGVQLSYITGSIDPEVLVKAKRRGATRILNISMPRLTLPGITRDPGYTVLPNCELEYERFEGWCTPAEVRRLKALGLAEKCGAGVLQISRPGNSLEAFRFRIEFASIAASAQAMEDMESDPTWQAESITCSFGVDPCGGLIDEGANEEIDVAVDQLVAALGGFNPFPMIRESKEAPFPGMHQSVPEFGEEDETLGPSDSWSDCGDE